MKTGIGKDVHRLVPGRKFLLGGVRIESDKGEDGHSDGDVLCHAIIDAMLGAAGLGDVGELFPPSDLRWKDANSLELLAIANKKIEAAGRKIINIDAVVECEAPKILPHRKAICSSIAKTLNIDVEQIFVKGKTGEGIGVIGRGEAVAATALCLLD